MPTQHDPPRPSQGEKKKRGGTARKPGQTKRQRAIDPQKLKVVAEMMAGGFDYYEMQKTLSDRWGVSMRTIRSWRDRILADMRDELEEAGFMEVGLEKVLCVRRLEEIYIKAMNVADLRTALGVLKTRALVAGVIGPRQVQHEWRPGAPAIPVAATLTPAEAITEARREVARRLAKRIAAGGAP